MELLAEIADLGFQVSNPLERGLQESPVLIAFGTQGYGGFGSKVSVNPSGSLAFPPAGDYNRRHAC